MKVIINIQKLSEIIIEDGDMTRAIHNHFIDVIDELKGVECIENLELDLENINESKVTYIEAKEKEIVNSIIHASVLLKRLYYDEQE